MSKNRIEEKLKELLGKKVPTTAENKDFGEIEYEMSKTCLRVRTETKDNNRETVDAQTGIFASPHTVGEPCPKCDGKEHTSVEAVLRFVNYFTKRIGEDAEFAEQVENLRGKNLLCNCGETSMCHAEIIAQWVTQHAKLDAGLPQEMLIAQEMVKLILQALHNMPVARAKHEIIQAMTGSLLIGWAATQMKNSTGVSKMRHIVEVALHELSLQLKNGTDANNSINIMWKD